MDLFIFQERKCWLNIKNVRMAQKERRMTGSEGVTSVIFMIGGGRFVCIMVELQKVMGSCNEQPVKRTKLLFYGYICAIFVFVSVGYIKFRLAFALT